MWIIMTRSEIMCQKFHHTILTKTTKIERLDSTLGHLSRKYLKYILHRINACFEFIRVESGQLHVLAEVLLIFVRGSDEEKNS